MAKLLKPIHPGEILREEFMVPLGLTANALAIHLRVSAPTVNELVRERKGITPEIALRLGQFFRTTPELWINLQARYDLEVAKDRAQRKIAQDVKPIPQSTVAGVPVALERIRRQVKGKEKPKHQQRFLHVHA